MRSATKKETATAVTNENFVHCNIGGWANRKPWMALITGEDKKYGLQREFLQPVGYRGGYPQYDLSQLPKWSVVEVNGGSTKNSYRVYLLVGKRYIFLWERCSITKGIDATIKRKILGTITRGK